MTKKATKRKGSGVKLNINRLFGSRRPIYKPMLREKSKYIKVGNEKKGKLIIQAAGLRSQSNIFCCATGFQLV
jgi:hypothetical protein